MGYVNACCIWQDTLCECLKDCQNLRQRSLPLNRSSNHNRQWQLCRTDCFLCHRQPASEKSLE